MLFFGVYNLSFCLLPGYNVRGLSQYTFIPSYIECLCKVKVNITLKEVKIFLQVFCLKAFGIIVFACFISEP